MPTGDLITQKEAAAILNRSKSAISRAISDGRLEYADPVRRLIFAQCWSNDLRGRQGRGLMHDNAKEPVSHRLQPNPC